ncbi:hypothetical protein BC829DRAFT_268494 [Chytridium lagenaria]|nr:hypothetical protein BC829DRAFT_268494 [Chytridium lagenaria]
MDASAPPHSPRLKNFAIYYGWPSCTNSSSLSWNSSAVARFYSQYNAVIFGGDVPGGNVGLEREEHGDHANTKDIIKQIHTLNRSTKVYGYVTIGCGAFGAGSMFTLDQLTTQINLWSLMGAKGIFIDEAGFDFWYPHEQLEMRERQVAVSKFTHGLGMAITFNAWNPGDLVDQLSLSSEYDIPWSKGDAIMYESYIFNAAQEDPHRARMAESFQDYRIHINALQRAKEDYGVEIWGCQTTLKDVSQFKQESWEFLVAAALVDGVDAVSWTTSQYSAGEQIMRCSHIDQYQNGLINLSWLTRGYVPTRSMGSHPGAHSIWCSST